MITIYISVLRLRSSWCVGWCRRCQALPYRLVWGAKACKLVFEPRARFSVRLHANCRAHRHRHTLRASPPPPPSSPPPPTRLLVGAAFAGPAAREENPASGRVEQMSTRISVVWLYSQCCGACATSTTGAEASTYAMGEYGVPRRTQSPPG